MILGPRTLSQLQGLNRIHVSIPYQPLQLARKQRIQLCDKYGKNQKHNSQSSENFFLSERFLNFNLDLVATSYSTSTGGQCGMSCTWSLKDKCFLEWTSACGFHWNSPFYFLANSTIMNFSNPPHGLYALNTVSIYQSIPWYL